MRTDEEGRGKVKMSLGLRMRNGSEQGLNMRSDIVSAVIPLFRVSVS